MFYAPTNRCSFKRLRRNFELDQLGVKSVPRLPHMHQASQVDQTKPELTRLMALPSNRLVASKWKTSLEETYLITKKSS